MKIEKMHIVAHSHWDREWYMSFAKHRYRLIKLIDDIIEALSSGELPYYHLDGQFVPIEDYLEIRKDKAEIIKELVRAGKLRIGPWYVLQDEYLVGSEANVRNLYYGIKESEKFGKVSMIGYLPDAFGNISQMPQILQGFGIDNAVLGRTKTPVLYGCDTLPEYKEGYSEIRWRAPDGSEVLGVQFTCWYDNARELPTDKIALKERLDRLFGIMSKVNCTPYYLGMNGCDHQPLQKDLAEAVKVANELGYPLEISHIERYLNDVRKYYDDFTVVEGEICSQKTAGYHTLRETASARVYIKQLNHKAEYLLGTLLEPVSAINALLGGKYDNDLIDYLWKTLLKNHPHDSICSCSVDGVIRDMQARYAAVIDTSEIALNDLYKNICIKGSVYSDSKNIVLFGLSPFESEGFAECELYFTKGLAPKYFTIKDHDGEDVEYEELFREDKKVYELPDDSFRQVYDITVVKIRLKVKTDGFGIKVYSVGNSETAPEYNGIKQYGNSIENDKIILTVNDNGSFDLFDKRTGKEYKEQNVYENVGDKGNEYNSEICGERVTTKNDKAEISFCVNGLSATATVINKFDISSAFDRHNDEFSDEKKTVTFKTTYTVYKNDEKVEIRTQFINECENHRIRALFNYAAKSDSVYADCPFDLTKRSITQEKEWESPNVSDRMNAFVKFADKEGGIVVATKGLNEYELNGNVLGITLVRCVDQMGDWFYFPTPEAQCKGERIAEYAFIPSTEDDVTAHRKAYEFVKLPFGITAAGELKDRIKDKKFFTISGGERLNYSAVKSAEDGSVIVRLYNPTETDDEITVVSDRKISIYTTSLDERKTERVFGNRILIDKKKIVTLKIRLESHASL